MQDEIKKIDKYVMIEDSGLPKGIARDDLDKMLDVVQQCESVGIYLEDELIIEREKDIIHIFVTTKEKKLVAISGVAFYLSEGIFINPEYYRDNRVECEKHIISIIEQCKIEYFAIDDNFELTDGIITAIINNPNIIYLNLRNKPLTVELFEKLKLKDNIIIRGKNIANELLDVFDGKIESNMYRDLISVNNGMSYNGLAKATILNFQTPISTDEINYIKKYASKLEIIDFEEGSFCSVRDLIESLSTNEISYRLILDTKNLYEVESFIKLQKDYPNIMVKYANKEVSISEYINLENEIAKLLKPIEGLELSPLEKFLFAFNTTKKFREYKENEEDKNKARNIFELFKKDNDNIVCVGFSILLDELCKRLHIQTIESSLNVDVSQTAKDGESFHAGHRRNMVHLKDDKYKIDGIYISDATWSNFMKHDIYTTALITPYETLFNDRMIYESQFDLFMAQSYEEFIEIIYLQYRKNQYYRFDCTLDNLFVFYPELEHELLKIEAYSKFKKERFPSIEDHRLLFSDETTMKKLFEQIYEKSNHVIDGTIIIEAALNLHRKINSNMTEDEINNLKSKLIEDNYKVYDKQFPAIVKEDNNGNKFLIANEQNKFGQGPRKI